MSRRSPPRQLDATHVRQRKERLARYRADHAGSRVRWVAVCDGQTCHACTQLHGQVLGLDDPAWARLVRLHAGCRCRFTLHEPSAITQGVEP